MKAITLALLLLTQLSIAADSKKRTDFSVMTYNLENLFDTKHDLGKKDWTYLPLRFKQSSKEVQAYCRELSQWYQKSCFELDWNQNVLDKKISNLARVIRTHKDGADVLVFQEVENINALTQLVSKKLNGLGYREIVLIEGPDSRGIDVAIVSKFPLISKRYHQISLAPHSDRTTRGILEAVFSVRGKSIAVMANHWPSQANSDLTRMEAAKVLLSAAAKVRADYVVAAGDFNTTTDDDINALKLKIEPAFIDTEIYGSAKSAPGTHWYKGEWESLDKIYLLKQKNNMTVSEHKIIFEKFMLKDERWVDDETGARRFDSDIPNRFDPETGFGYSDHLPAVTTFRL